MYPVETPFKVYTGRDGKPINNGYVYFGVAGQNPITAPITVYWDAAGTQPAAQPLRTENGYIMRAGSPANVFCPGEYSELVKDARGRQVFFARTSADFSIVTLVLATLASLASSIGASLIGFLQAGVGAIVQTVQEKLRSGPATIWDFLSTVKRVQFLLGVQVDVTTELQALLDAHLHAVIYGNLKITSTIYMKRSGACLRGRGIGNTFVEFVNAAGGTAFAGHASGGVNVITDCEISGFSIANAVAGTGPSVGLDITTFAYSRFDLSIQTRRVNGVCIYGAGNSGSSPYYNHIEGYLFGGADYSQTGIKFDAGSFAGGSNGPNSNMIGPIYRAAALGILCDLVAGTGNMFSKISGESIGDFYFRLNNVAAYSLSGTSSGANNVISLKDTSKAMASNAYVNYGVIITGGTGAGQVRIIANNTATQFNVTLPWAVIPDATSTYSICKNQCGSNKFSQIRAEGLSTLNPDFISALPGTQSCHFDGTTVESLGSGLFVRDQSGATSNKWFDGSRQIVIQSIVPGASANTNIYARNSVFGGATPPRYVVEYLSVAASAASPGDVATVYLDVGGTAMNTASEFTLSAALTATTDVAVALTPSTQKLVRDGTNRHLFLGVQTGAAFGPAVGLTITYCITVDP